MASATREAKTQVCSQIHPRLLDRLDSEAKQLGESRNRVLERAIEYWLRRGQLEAVFDLLTTREKE